MRDHTNRLKELMNFTWSGLLFILMFEIIIFPRKKVTYQKTNVQYTFSAHKFQQTRFLLTSVFT
jgi:hypothetical protein